MQKILTFLLFSTALLLVNASTSINFENEDQIDFDLLEARGFDLLSLYGRYKLKSVINMRSYNYLVVSQ